MHESFLAETEMTELNIPIPNFEKSPAEKILSETKGKIQKLILKKLMPKSAWEVPPIVIHKFEKGDIIGNIRMSIYSSDNFAFNLSNEVFVCAPPDLADGEDNEE